MQLVFTKLAGKYDRLEIRRSFGSTETIDCPKQGIIPHDMVHYAVEHVLQERGFLTRVKEGEAAQLTMKAEDRSDGVERLVEVIQGDAWSGGRTAPAEILALYQVTCSARSCTPLGVDSEGIEAIRSEIAMLSARWSSVAVGGSLELVL
jgi:hypothetical protein